MFSKLIVQTDAFMDMPSTAQLLYFHLAMEADDDGFVSAPKKIMKTIGSADDDYKILIGKRFVIPFDNGVCVIKHWLIHNYIRKDTYTPTNYLEEKKTLQIKENRAYTETVHEPSTQIRLDKGREEKRESSLNFLKEISKEEIQEFTLKFKCEDANVKTKANALYDYCKAKGRVYKNYKSFLSNALRKDFGERPPKEKVPNYVVENGVAVMKGYK